MRRTFLQYIVIVIFGTALTRGQIGSLDESFNPVVTSPSIAQNSINAVIVSERGILVGGTFTGINGSNVNRIARLKIDGSIDESFHVGFGIEGTNSGTQIFSILVQPDEKILLGGFFTSYDRTRRIMVARLHSDGSLDPAFQGAEPEYVVHSLGLISDGRLLIGGSFYHVNGVLRTGVALLMTNGVPDFAFSSRGGGRDLVHVTKKDQIVLGGGGGVCKIGLDGQIDPAFACDSTINTTITALAEDEEGNYWRATAQQFLSDSEAADSQNVRMTYAKMAAEQAALLLHHKHAAEAEEAFRLATEIGPASSEAVYRYVNLLVEQKRFEEAIPVVEAAVKADLNNQQQFRQLAQELQRMKKN